jgi:hypothetical protein
MSPKFIKENSKSVINKEKIKKELTQIPGVGKSISEDLWNIGVRSISDLKGQDPEELYKRSNAHAGIQQDRCLLYVFRCAVYYAETEAPWRAPELLKWWNWKDEKLK